MAEGKDQREQRVGASPANQQPIWVWARCWGSHTPWNFPSDIGSGDDAFLCRLQPIPSRGRESRVTGGGGMQKGETGFSGALWSGGTPLPQLLDKGFNYFLFHFLQFLPHLFQKLLKMMGVQPMRKSTWTCRSESPVS